MTERKNGERDRLKVYPGAVLLLLLTLTIAACNVDATPPSQTRTPKPTFTVEISGSTADNRLQIKTPTPSPSATMMATPTETRTPTPVPTTTLTSTPTFETTRTSLPVKARDTVVVPATRAPEPTKTEVVVPKYPFEIVGQPKLEPNCGTIYIKGMVVDQQGNPVNGVAVELNFFDNKVIRKTGEGGEDLGRFGFAPLDRRMFKTQVDFKLELVGPNGEHGLSPVLDLPFTDCDKWGQATGIVFKSTK